MSDVHFAVIKGRHFSASHGPYESHDTEDAWSLHVKGFPFQILKAPKKHPTMAEYWPRLGDAAFLTHAWQDVADLIRETERLRAENAELSERATLLSALEAAGVDNWEGYSHAYGILAEWEEEDDDNA
jgi:hypothetical protein